MSILSLLKKSYSSLVTYEHRHFSANLLFLVAWLSATFLPDVLIAHFYKLPIHIEWLFFIGITCFGLLLSFTNAFIFCFFIAIIFLMELIQLNYMVFFGESIEAENLLNIVREARDVFDLTYLKQTWFVFLLLIGLYGLCVYLFFKKSLIKVKFVWILIFYLALHKPYRAYSETKGIWYFQPSITRPSLKNSISTFSYFFFQYYPKGYQNISIQYQPYQIIQGESETQNILLVWGESLYAEHLPMFGYERNTFPLMSERINNNTNWKQALTISGGIATATSTLLFFNTVREPANANELKAQTANLFRVAKQAGFNTYYYSNQESRLTMGLGSKYIDDLETNDSQTLLFTRYKDEGLEILLDKLDLSEGKNFIVLHMRSPHLPYENRYRGREAEFEKFLPATPQAGRYDYTVNTYDNALLYTDFVLDKFIKTFQKKTANTISSIYITADHGQLFNYEGHWGHNSLLIEQGKVPFFVYLAKDKTIPQAISHYQIGKLIIEDLGFDLNNPNEQDNQYYLHGNNIDYPYDYIKYMIDDNGVPLELFVGNTLEKKDN